MSPAVALTVAGSDSGGGAGLQADLHTFAAFGVHGTTAVTAVTVQNTVGVTGVHEIPPGIVADQIAAVVADLRPTAVKTGMLASAPIIAAIGDAFRRHGIGRDGTIPLVLDPVCASMHGDPLLKPDALDALRELFALATVVTPNVDETQLLVGTRDQDDAARALLALGTRYALVKGGHGTGPRSRDLLTDGVDEVWLDAARIDTGNTHGSGDTLAAAITARLATGDTLPDAVATAKRYVTRAVATSYSVGAGHGPVGHPPAEPPPNTTPPRSTKPAPATAVPAASAPGASVPGAAVPGNPAPVASASGRAGSAGSVPGAAVPGSSVPVAAGPGLSAPVASAPAAAAPGASVPGDFASGAAVPGAAVPGASAPGASAPGASAPGAGVPGGAGSAASVPGASVPGASVSGASVPGGVDGGVWVAGAGGPR